MEKRKLECHFKPFSSRLNKAREHRQHQGIMAGSPFEQILVLGELGALIHPFRGHFTLFFLQVLSACLLIKKQKQMWVWRHHQPTNVNSVYVLPFQGIVSSKEKNRRKEPPSLAWKETCGWDAPLVLSGWGQDISKCSLSWNTREPRVTGAWKHVRKSPACGKARNVPHKLPGGAIFTVSFMPYDNPPLPPPPGCPKAKSCERTHLPHLARWWGRWWWWLIFFLMTLTEL